MEMPHITVKATPDN